MGDGCAISQASADIMLGMVIGCKKEDALKKSDIFMRMIRGEATEEEIESLEEAYELNQKKANRIVGGMMWMRMGDNRMNTAIDMSGLGLDKIEESDEEFKIGCMTTLRQLEVHESFNEYTDGCAKEALRHIVGVQFRNLATVGGSIYGRYGFSDVLTLLIGLDSYCLLYTSPSPRDA